MDKFKLPEIPPSIDLKRVDNSFVFGNIIRNSGGISVADGKNSFVGYNDIDNTDIILNPLFEQLYAELTDIEHKEQLNEIKQLLQSIKQDEHPEVRENKIKNLLVKVSQFLSVVGNIETGKKLFTAIISPLLPNISITYLQEIPYLKETLQILGLMP
jgi:hypothetical protein